MANNRIDRISAEYQRVMAEALRSVKDPRISGMVSVTRCEVTGDLRYAKVYISILGGGSDKEALKGLKSASGYLRHAVGEKMQLRAAPEPVFRIDGSIRYGAHILEKLHEIEEKRSE